MVNESVCALADRLAAQKSTAERMGFSFMQLGYVVSRKLKF